MILAPTIEDLVSILPRSCQPEVVQIDVHSKQKRQSCQMQPFRVTF